MKNWLKENWFKLLAILFLLGALGDWPYGYYQFLRWIITFIGAYTAYIAYNNKQNGWAWIFGIIAILFNPILPFYLSKGTWQFIDVVVAIVFFVSFFINMRTKNRKLDVSLNEPIEKRELQQTISEKEKLLIELVEEIERFKIDLYTIKQEYDIKVSRLYLKLDKTNLEILKFKKIEDLINKGFSLEKSRKIVEDILKKKHEQIEEEYKKINEEEKDIEKRKTISQEEQEELKKLFHKLAHKFHPDLIGGNDAMMKKINKAYANRDLEILRAIDQDEDSVNVEIKTIEELLSKLARLKESIKKALYEQEQLKHSEWAILKENIEKAKKQKRDILNELAEKVIKDIAKKENILDELKKKYGQ